MKCLAVLVAALFVCFPALAIKKIACVGASITEGVGTEPRSQKSFPAQLQTLLGNEYTIYNYGVSGTTLIRKGDRPYWNTKQYQEALANCLVTRRPSLRGIVFMPYCAKLVCLRKQCSRV